MNILYTRIRELALEKGVSLSQIERNLDFSNGSISSWKKGRASQDKILAVAKYFDVSTDYLLGRTNIKKESTKNLTVDEALDHAMSFNGKPISDHDREVVKSIVEAYLNKQNEEWSI